MEFDSNLKFEDKPKMASEKSFIFSEEDMSNQNSKKLVIAKVEINQTISYFKSMTAALSLVILMIFAGLIVGLVVMGMQNQSLKMDLKSQKQIAANFQAQLQNAENKSKATIIDMTKQNGKLLKDFEKWKQNISQVINVNGKNERGNTELHLASTNGEIEKVKMLLNFGADLEIKNLYRQSTALHLASSEGHLEIVKLLLGKGANVNSLDIYQYTPLHNAAKNGHSEVVELLLKNRAEINALNSYDRTPLHLGASNGYSEVVKILLKHGAKSNLRDKSNYTPLQHAKYYREGDYEQVIALLESENNN